MPSAASAQLLGVLLLVSALLVPVATAATTRKSEYDVCVVGAGGSGAFAAVALKDADHSVLVLEKEDMVGGHCETWTDPVSGLKIDTGVVLYCDDPLIVSTFRRFNVTLVPFDTIGEATKPAISFSANGTYLGPPPAATAANAGAFMQAYGLWLGTFAQRWAFLETENGAMPNFDALPLATMTMLDRPFGELLDQLEAEFGKGAFDPLLPMWSALMHIGSGSVRDTMALNVLKAFRPAILNILVGKGFTVAGGCSEIYNKFHEYLGDSVKLNAAPFSFKRPKKASSGEPIELKYTQDGRRVRSSCRHLIISAVQTMENLKSFMTDLDKKEKAVFKQVTANTLSKSIVRITEPTLQQGGRALTALVAQGSDLGISIPSLSSSDLPTTVGLTAYRKQGLGLTWTTSLHPNDPSKKGVVDLLYANLTDWSKKSGEFQVPATKSDLVVDGPDLHAWWPRPKRAQDTAAFYRSLYALQGHRSTYYTGALLSFNAQYDVWRYSNWLVRNHTWA